MAVERAFTLFCLLVQLLEMVGIAALLIICGVPLMPAIVVAVILGAVLTELGEYLASEVPWR